MNFVNSKIVQACIKIFFAGIVTGPCWAWEIDFSRRQLDFQKIQDQDRKPASVTPETTTEESILSESFDSTGPSQDIVITHTENGFVPRTLRLRKGGNYKIHVVNIDAKEKNVSFVLDAFSQSHNTVFGNMRTFQLTPKQAGTYSFLCPETAKQGQIIIFADERKPASK